MPSPDTVPPQFLSAPEIERMRAQLAQKEMTIRMSNLNSLPDKGKRMLEQVSSLKRQLAAVDQYKIDLPPTAFSQLSAASGYYIEEKGAIPKTTTIKSNLSEDELRRKVQSTKVSSLLIIFLMF